MKVLMICTVPLSGNGIATCVINYATALAQKTNMHVLAPEGVPEGTQQTLTQQGVRLHQLPDRKTGLKAYLAALLRLLRQERFDVVHIHGNSCTVSIELLAAALAGCPVRIAHSHNTSCDHKKAHRLLRPVFELLVNGRLACGQEAGKWLFHKKSFQVLRNGIDLSGYAADETQRAAIRQQLGLTDNMLVLGHIGLFIPAKNHKFLMQIAKSFADRTDKDWKLLLLSDGPLMDEIRQCVDQLNLSDHIIFIGRVPNTSGYLQAMDLFLLPSLHEGLPFVLVEAQASGLDALVSDQVSTEVDMTGNLQFLPIDDPEIWADKILQSAKPNRYQHSQDACKALHDAGYSIEGNADFLLGFYTDLLSKKH
ncbi:MAG: glycosyltransferase [Oscillospiraceae bacterium]|nr:glycosyltransferase [Oscillospiraceae bacterium]